MGKLSQIEPLQRKIQSEMDDFEDLEDYELFKIIANSIIKKPMSFDELMGCALKKSKKKYQDWTISLAKTAFEKNKTMKFYPNQPWVLEELLTWIKTEFGYAVKEEDLEFVYGIPLSLTNVMKLAIDGNAIICKNGKYAIRNQKIVDYLKYVWDLKENKEIPTTTQETVKIDGNSRYNYWLSQFNIVRDAEGLIKPDVDRSKLKKFELGLFFVPVDFDGNLVDEFKMCSISQSLDEEYGEYYKKEKKITPIERLMGFELSDRDSAVLSKVIDKNYLPSVFCSAKGDNLTELKNDLFRCLKLMKDTAQDNDVIFSPLLVPLNKKFDIKSPSTIFSQKTENYCSMDITDIKGLFNIQRHTWNGMFQYMRNSIPFVNMNNRGIKDYYLFLTIMDSSLTGKSYEVFVSKDQSFLYYADCEPDVPIYDYLQSASGKLTKRWPTILPSVDEMIASTAVNAALNEKTMDWFVNQKRYFTLTPTELTKLKIIAEVGQHMLRDKPINYILKQDIVKDLGSFTGTYIVEHAIGKARDLELLGKLVSDGYVIGEYVSDVWPVFLGLIEKELNGLNIPDAIKPIIQNDFATKYGTRTLYDLREKMSYAELIRTAWDNLCSGKRWIS